LIIKAFKHGFNLEKLEKEIEEEGNIIARKKYRILKQ